MGNLNSHAHDFHNQR